MAAENEKKSSLQANKGKKRLTEDLKEEEEANVADINNLCSEKHSLRIHKLVAREWEREKAKKKKKKKDRRTKMRKKHLIKAHYVEIVIT